MRGYLCFVLWLIAAHFCLIQNRYFGWNAHANSDAELIADGITFLMIALALIGTLVAFPAAKRKHETLNSKGNSDEQSN